jgi:hypothetical protein
MLMLKSILNPNDQIRKVMRVPDRDGVLSRGPEIGGEAVDADAVNVSRTPDTSFG